MRPLSRATAASRPALLAWTALEFGALLGAAPMMLFPHRYGVPQLVLATGVLALPRLVTLSRQHRPAPRTALDVPVVALLIMSVVATAASTDWALSQPKLFGLVFGFATYFALTSCIVRWGSPGLGLVSALLAIQGVAIAGLALVGANWHAYKYPGLASFFGRLPQLVTRVEASTGTVSGLEPNQVGGVLLLIWPLLLACSVWPQPRRATKAALVIMCLFVVGVIVLTLSRSTYAGLLAGGAVILSLALRPPRKHMLAAAASAPLLLAIGLRAAPAAGALPTHTSNPFVGAGSEWASRVALWERAIAMVTDFPLTGIGLNSFPVVLDTQYPVNLFGPALSLPHAHNLYLQTAIDLGVPGLVAFLWCLVLAVRSWLAAWSSCGRVRDACLARPILAGLLGGLTAHLVFGLTDAVVLGAKPSYLLWMLLAALAAAPLVIRSPHAATPDGEFRP